MTEREWECHLQLDQGSTTQFVIPGTDRESMVWWEWIPAFTGMTEREWECHLRLDQGSTTQFVIPGTDRESIVWWEWIPAFAGMTEREGRNDKRENGNGGSGVGDDGHLTENIQQVSSGLQYFDAG